MRTSVVVLTYNWPQALDAVLRGLKRQAVQPFEVIVSDDGSDESTAAVVRNHAGNFPTRLVHLWQPDDGARMSRARNRGIAAAQGDHVILLDGDMVPGRDFVADHRAFARTGCYVQGSRVLLGETATRRLLAAGELDVGFFARDIQRRRNNLGIPVLARLNGRPHRRRAGTKSCNMGFWKADLVRLNGFDEAMTGWGREDTELVMRAFNAGLLRRDLRFGGIALHLWHATRKRMLDNPNDAILRKTEREGRTRCEKGLQAHLPVQAAPPDLRDLAAPAPDA
jgi:glycosyltransferase involved in cell wall biosynthesis